MCLLEVCIGMNHGSHPSLQKTTEQNITEVAEAMKCGFSDA